MKRHSRTRPQPRTKSGVIIIFSRIASFVFHPFFMTTAGALIVWKLIPRSFDGNSSVKTFIWMLALLTILLPFIAVFLFRKLNLISDTKMHEPADRIYPLVTALIFYTTAYWLIPAGFPVIIHSLLLGSCYAIFILFVVTSFYKVSVHTTAAAILPGICLVLAVSEKMIIAPLFFASVVAIIVGLVRWLLGAHTIGQILLGYLTGIFTQFVAYYYLR